MALPNSIPAGSDGAVITAAINALIADRNAAISRQDMNNKDIINARIVQGTQFYSGGKLLGDGIFGVRTASPTSNPLIWNFTAINVNQVEVKFNGLAQPLGNYAISGSVAQLALLNPGFESGLTNWAGTSDAAISTVNPHTSSKSASLSSNSGYIYQPLAGLISGVTYPITGWVRGDSGTTAAALLAAHDGTGANAPPTVSVVPGVGWEPLVLYYTANSTGVVGFSVQRGSGSGSVYFDDIVISGGGAPSVWTITFAPGNQPRVTGEDVTISGNIT